MNKTILLLPAYLIYSGLTQALRAQHQKSIFIIKVTTCYGNLKIVDKNLFESKFTGEVPTINATLFRIGRKRITTLALNYQWGKLKVNENKYNYKSGLLELSDGFKSASF